jgi:hypothetical protein
MPLRQMNFTHQSKTTMAFSRDPKYSASNSLPCLAQQMIAANGGVILRISGLFLIESFHNYLQIYPLKSDTFSPFPQVYDKLENAGYVVNQIKNLHIHPHIP